MNCPICKSEMTTIQPTLWGCIPCDSLWTPERLSDHILWLSAAYYAVIETARSMSMMLDTILGIETAIAPDVGPEVKP